jgi:hypothetical protein
MCVQHVFAWNIPDSFNVSMIVHGLHDVVHVYDDIIVLITATLSLTGQDHVRMPGHRLSHFNYQCQSVLLCESRVWQYKLERQ